MGRTVEIPDDIVRFLDTQVTAGRFANTAEALRASVQALTERDASDSEKKTELLRTAWNVGMQSLQEHGAQLETESDFEEFLDECESDATRQ